MNFPQVVTGGITSYDRAPCRKFIKPMVVRDQRNKSRKKIYRVRAPCFELQQVQVVLPEDQLLPNQ